MARKECGNITNTGIGVTDTTVPSSEVVLFTCSTKIIF